MSKIYSDAWMNDQGFFDSLHEQEETVQSIQYIK
jgi:cystathionine beta-synthase